MIVDHFSSYAEGGAGIAARRIHEAVRAAGVESRFWCSRIPTSSVDTCHSFAQPPPKGVARILGQLRKLSHKTRIWSALKGRPGGLEPFAPPEHYDPTPCPAAALRGDLLHLHWVGRRFDYPTFFGSLPRSHPVVWTLHDMRPMTGGCHYAGDCRGFTSACGNCWQLGRPSPNDLSRQGWTIARKALDGRALHVVADSFWLEEEARRSSLFADAVSIRTIHYGLDVEVFRPRDRKASRIRLGIPADAEVIAFAAESTLNRRKGLAELLQAVELLQDRPRLRLLLFGHGTLPNDPRRPPTTQLGFLPDPESQAWAYSAADLFALPSLQEAFGQTGLESLACGTPVVAFAAGGITDYVRPGSTGYLADVRDVRGLAHGIRQLLDNEAERARMGREGRTLVERDFHAARQGQDYLRLYEQILEHHAGAPRGTRSAGFG